MTDWGVNNVQFTTQGRDRREGLETRSQLCKKIQYMVLLSAAICDSDFFHCENQG